MQPLFRLALIAAVLPVAGVLVWSYSRNAREQTAQSTPSYSAVSNALATQPEPAAVVSASSSAESATSASSIDQLIADATSSDPAARAAAIVALGNAPKQRVLPVLQSLASGGEIADRQSALKSLTKIAIEQGDSDRLIRDAIRQVISHGEDETVTQSAQAALEAVEAGLATSH